MPDVVGTWPAFWLLADPGTGTHNEIDVIEMLGGRPTQQHIGHNWGYVEGQKHSQGKLLTTPDLSTAFHTYGVLWTATTIAYYRDDIELAHYPNQGLNQRMYILLNIAMDGDWNKQQGFVAAPDARASMDVEYVRAYALP
jgi:beta-glucanase (GH16 family)